MESTSVGRLDDAAERDRSAARQADPQRSTAREAERAWLERSGAMLDERAFLTALGRGGAQRMAIPVDGS